MGKYRIHGLLVVAALSQISAACADDEVSKFFSAIERSVSSPVNPVGDNIPNEEWDRAARIAVEFKKPQFYKAVERLSEVRPVVFFVAMRMLPDGIIFRERYSPSRYSKGQWEAFTRVITTEMKHSRRLRERVACYIRWDDKDGLAFRVVDNQTDHLDDEMAIFASMVSDYVNSSSKDVHFEFFRTYIATIFSFDFEPSTNFRTDKALRDYVGRNRFIVNHKGLYEKSDSAEAGSILTSYGKKDSGPALKPLPRPLMPTPECDPDLRRLLEMNPGL